MTVRGSRRGLLSGRSETRFRTLYEKSAQPMALWDGETFIDCNEAVLRLFNARNREDFVGHTPAELTPELQPGGVPTPELAREVYSAALEQGTHRFDAIHRKVDGEEFWAEVVLTAVPIDGRVLIHTAFHDITERKRAQAELLRLAAAVGQAAEAVVITDTAGLISYVNPAFETLTGYRAPEVLGLDNALLERGGQRSAATQEMRRTLVKGGVWSGHVTYDRKDGAPLEVVSTVSPVRDYLGRIVEYVAIMRDVTTERRLERRLSQTQKMEALGTLAGGIAHDFNNILSMMMGCAELAIDSCPPGAEMAGELECIVSAGMRAKEVVAQILTFARQDEQELLPLRLGSIVRETLKLLHASFPAAIEIRQPWGIDGDLVLADPTQIHQVVLNLCTNARQAMGDGPGVLSVTLDRVAVEARFAAEHPQVGVGEYVRLSVSDTGCGMEPEVKQRVFEPFFTTKRPGEGTGMGLSVVHGIVNRHGGAVFVQSEPGKGSTFSVLLPCATGEEPAFLEELETSPRGTERLLLVDDEEPLLDLTSRALRLLGYRTTALNDGPEALRRVQAEPEEYDLVVADLTMPRMTGLALARELRRLRPDLPVILCTGFRGALSGEEAARAGIREVVQKPVTPRQLAGAVRRVLDR